MGGNKQTNDTNKQTMIYQIILGALMVVSTQAAAEPRRVEGPAAFIISGVQEDQYADPNGIYVRTTVRAYHQLMSSKRQTNLCPETRQVDTCYVQMKIFDNQPAWVILPARHGWREPRNVRNYFWEMSTTGEWQHADTVERRLEGRDSLWTRFGNIKKVGDL